VFIATVVSPSGGGDGGGGGGLVGVSIHIAAAVHEDWEGGGAELVDELSVRRVNLLFLGEKSPEGKKLFTGTCRTGLRAGRCRSLPPTL
jgi:hypothetical protein